MTTHRSLNKLEFKAHMNIHNLKDVEETETHDLNATRDRFGKKHQLSDPNGASRIVRRKQKLRIAALTTLLGVVYCEFAAADPLAPPEDASPTHSTIRRNTDIRVETEGLDANSWINQKFNQPEEKFGIPIDENTAIGINDDGDPNMAMSF